MGYVAPDSQSEDVAGKFFDREQLEALTERVLEVKSWEELSDKPKGSRRNGKRRKNSKTAQWNLVN